MVSGGGTKMSDLITRAREYLKDKYLDVADVPKFIKKLVELHESNEELRAKVAEQYNTIGYLEDRVDKLEDELDEMYMGPL